ncbi:MAG TPA: hypothetical protein VI911_08330 [Patescibacteria group bacterium]|nr:hypothetical protein [Patescibacteria group bacterium]
MNKIIVFGLTLLLSCAPVLSSAATTAENNTVVTVDLSKVPPDVATQLLSMQKKAAQEAKESGSIVTDIKEVTDGLDPEKIQAWSLAVGSVIKEVAGSIGISVNDFLKTPAGWGLAGVILWKTGGPYLVDKCVAVVFGSSAWLLLTCIWLYVFYKLFFAKKKVIIEKDSPAGIVKTTTYENYTTWPQNHKLETDRPATMLLAVFLYLIICGVSALVVI